jgi:hypothetical protein
MQKAVPLDISYHLAELQHHLIIHCWRCMGIEQCCMNTFSVFVDRYQAILSGSLSIDLSINLSIWSSLSAIIPPAGRQAVSVRALTDLRRCGFVADRLEAACNGCRYVRMGLDIFSCFPFFGSLNLIIKIKTCYLELLKLSLY